VALLASGTALGQVRTVVVVNGTATEAAGREAVSSVTRAIAANPRLELVPPSELSRTLSAAQIPPSEAVDAEVKSHLQDADDAIAAFDYDRALIALFRAERPLIDLAPSHENRRALADVNFRLGLIYLAQQDRDRARAAFRAVHFLVPGSELDPARYPPDVVGEFERARPGSPDASLSIAASVPGAAVFVNGRPVAASPAEVEVPAGAHYVLVSQPGYRPSGRRIVVQSGGVEPVRIALAPVPKTVQAARLRHALRARTVQTEGDVIFAGRRAMQLAQADAAIVIVTRNERSMATAITGDRTTASQPLPSEVAALLDELAPAPIEIPLVADRPWYREPLTLAVGGAALATVSILTVVLLSSGDDMRATGGICFPPDC